MRGVRAREAARTLQQGRTLAREMVVEGFLPDRSLAPDGLADIAPTPGTKSVFVGTLAEAPDADIVLSAGRPDAFTGRSCDNKNAGNCSLYWLRIRGGLVYAERLRQANMGISYVQPAISPKGRRVAYIEKLGTTHRAIVVQTLGGTTWHDALRKSPDVRGPQWPDWVDGTTIAFNRHKNAARSPPLQDPNLWTVPASGSGAPTELLGSDTEFYSDVDVLQGRRALWLVSHRQAPPDAPREYWTAQDAVPASQVITPGTRTESRFGGAWVPDSRGARLNECQHPSWAPDGEAITCFGHLPRVRRRGTNGLLYFVRPLYKLVKNPSGRWIGSTDGPFGSALLHRIPSQGELVAAYAQSGGKPLFDVFEEEDTLHFKNPRWFRKNWVLASVLLERNLTKTAPYARTTLIRRDPLGIFDLVRFVEVLEGASPNSWHGYTATTLRMEPESPKGWSF